jgi:glycosyltransferase involved in cell wall biosynthesis
MNSKSLQIAYFVNQYPKVSHSFIRREILALEKLGFKIKRYALRTDEDELVDPQDLDELNKTNYVLKQSALTVFLTALNLLFRHPIRFVNALLIMLKLGWRSDRGLLRHLIYFAEACVLYRWLRLNQIEHVHAHFGTNSTTVVLLAKKLGGPTYSFTVHGPEEFDKPEFISLGEKVKHSAFVVAISSFGRSQIYRWCEHEYWDKVKIVHCGLDSDFYEGDIRYVEATSKLVCVGRICEQKGQLLLVEAVAQLVAEGCDIHLVLAGDGPMRAEIEQLIEHYNISKNIHITGWISSDRVREELLEARALVLPSFAEGLPVVIMEAMALKRPVLSTYVAGIPELVRPGENGFLVPAGSIDALKEAISMILDMSKTDLHEFGKSARNRVLQRHNIDTEASKLAEYIRAVIT